MTNDEGTSKSKRRNTQLVRPARFGIRASVFFRHSKFGLHVFSVAAGFQRVCVYRGASARAPHGVFGALAASGCGGGRQVERRKRTYPKVPIGTIESSPRFQPWVASGEWPEPRPPSRRSGALARREGGRGDRKDGTGPVRSFVPDGTCFTFAPEPSDESLGYFRSSLRDLELRYAKCLLGRG